ncbi:hypothetical protein DL769_008156 [Monosporascus sp. CRB-8-3]|nr:hypothetical protein DL769_008156 [Monosporascus sp. CRB-8-3]
MKQFEAEGEYDPNAAPQGDEEYEKVEYDELEMYHEEDSSRHRFAISTDWGTRARPESTRRLLVVGRHADDQEREGRTTGPEYHTNTTEYTCDTVLANTRVLIIARRYAASGGAEPTYASEVELLERTTHGNLRRLLRELVQELGRVPLQPDLHLRARLERHRLDYDRVHVRRRNRAHVLARAAAYDEDRRRTESPPSSRIWNCTKRAWEHNGHLDSRGVAILVALALELASRTQPQRRSRASRGEAAYHIKVSRPNPVTRVVRLGHMVTNSPQGREVRVDAARSPELERRLRLDGSDDVVQRLLDAQVVQGHLTINEMWHNTTRGLQPQHAGFDGDEGWYLVPATDASMEGLKARWEHVWGGSKIPSIMSIVEASVPDRVRKKKFDSVIYSTITFDEMSRHKSGSMYDALMLKQKSRRAMYLTVKNPTYWHRFVERSKTGIVNTMMSRLGVSDPKGP